MITAIAKFGAVFPRSQSKRREFLCQFQGKTGNLWDPFHALNDPFYGEISSDAGFNSPRKFTEPANNWLKNICGIFDLATGYKDGKPGDCPDP